jgi:hypothetical protein
MGDVVKLKNILGFAILLCESNVSPSPIGQKRGKHLNTVGCSDIGIWVVPSCDRNNHIDNL